MSLLSTDITRVKKISLRGLKLPAAKRKEVQATPLTVEPKQLPTEEEIAYSAMVEDNPFIEDLVETLDLVSDNTGKRIRKVDQSIPLEEPKLLAISQQVIQPEMSYSKQDIIDRVIQINQISSEQADKGFNLLLQTGYLEPTPGGRYYLASSTPF